MSFRQPWQDKTNGILSRICSACGQPLVQQGEPVVLFCLPCWQATTVRRWPPRILAVDDDIDSLLVLSVTLESFGFPYVSLTKGLVMVPFLHRYPADLILLDARLADIDSHALVQSLKRNPVTRAIPVVAVTALARPKDREDLLAAGFNDYLSKPFQISELRATILRNLPSPST